MGVLTPPSHIQNLHESLMKRIDLLGLNEVFVGDSAGFTQGQNPQT